jgi:hypothetical protein
MVRLDIRYTLCVGADVVIALSYSYQTSLSPSLLLGISLLQPCWMIGLNWIGLGYIGSS